MRRRLLKLALMISLILCALTILLWISTYFRAVRYTKISESAGAAHPLFLAIQTTRGELSVEETECMEMLKELGQRSNRICTSLAV